MHHGDAIEFATTDAGTGVSVPEATEIAAPTVCWITSPKELARRFVIQSGHIGFYESLVVLEQRNTVIRNHRNIRKEAILLPLRRKCFLHTICEDRRRHNWVEPI